MTNNEIKIGDTVDCSGCVDNHFITCAGGEVINGPNCEGGYAVKGKWTGGSDWNFVRPDQITRHVPAAPVVERPKSCGDKLASEMTVREHMILEYSKNNALINNNSYATDIELATQLSDALIAALDKERTK
jgi:hypothetical protein